MTESYREVELRFEVAEEVWNELRNDLFATEAPRVSEQDDLYFDLTGCSFIAHTPVEQWVRLREEHGRFEVNRKQFHYPPGSDHASHADEFSFTVPDRDQAVKILSTLGFTELVRVQKTRYRYISLPGVEVAFDLVKDLGWFVEIEALGQSDSLDRVTATVESIAARLDLQVSEQDRRGYPYMLLHRSGRL